MKILNKAMITAFVFLLWAAMANAQLSNKAYYDNMIQVDSVLVGSVWQPVFAIYSGDINQDGNIDYLDVPELTSVIESPYPYGYLVSDLNGDGASDYLDVYPLTANIERNPPIGLMRPY